MWDLTSPTRDQTHVPCNRRQIPNQWITREVPMKFIEKLFFPSFLDQVCSLFVNKYPDNSEKAMAPHSSTLAWKIPLMEEPGGLQSMGSLVHFKGLKFNP